MRPETKTAAKRSLRPLWVTAVLCALIAAGFLTSREKSSSPQVVLQDQSHTLAPEPVESPAAKVSPAEDVEAPAAVGEEVDLDDEPIIAKVVPAPKVVAKSKKKITRTRRKSLPVAKKPVVIKPVVKQIAPPVVAEMVPAPRPSPPSMDLEDALASLSARDGLNILVETELENTLPEMAGLNPVEPELEEKFPLLPRYTEFVPEYVKDDFADIRARLDFFQRENLEVVPTPEVQVAKAPEISEPLPVEKIEPVEKVEAVMAEAPIREVPVQPEAEETATAFQSRIAQSGGLLAELAKDDEIADQKEEQRQRSRHMEEEHLAAERAEQEEQAALMAELKEEPKPEEASLAGSLLALAPKPEPELVAPPVTTPAPETTQPVVPENTQRRKIPAPPEVVENTEIDERTLQDADSTYGKLHLDTPMKKWLQTRRGHVELHLVPVDRTDKQPQDIKWVHRPESESIFRYSAAEPQEQFEIEKEELHSAYRLIARFYVPGKRRAVSSVPYEKVISPRNYKEAVHFHLTKNEFNKFRHRGQNVLSDSVLLTAIIYEGASGNYRAPGRIGGALVRVLGFPQWGTFVSKADGTVQIPNVPLRSELLLEVTAPNYYPTQKVVSTFGADELALVYLISKDKVEAITKYFTKNPQNEKKAIVMGRAFNEKGRPLEGEKVNLSYRKGPAVYIDSLPDLLLPSTTKTGLFGFFNITPSFRAVGRAIGQWPGLLNLKEGFAHYIEFGRGGKHPLRGHVYDPVNDSNVVARVRLVGMDAKDAIYTDAEGRFEIPNVDLPAGVVTLEVDSGEQYPSMWYTLPWDPRESGVEHTLALVEREIVQLSAADAKLKSDYRKGTILGGAEPTLFEGRKGCVTVSLMDSKEVEVPSEKGPFVWGQEAGARHQSLCLDSENPRFAFYNLDPGEYILKWRDARMGSFRPRVLYVGPDQVAMVTEISSDTFSNPTGRKSPSETEPIL